MRLASVALAAVLVAVAASSCGEPSAVVPSGGSGGVASAAGGGGAGAGGEAPYSLDNYCARAAPLFCQAIQSCCEEDLGFDEALCQARWTEELCLPMVEHARAGRFVFRPAELEPAAAEALVEGCFASFTDYASTCGEADIFDYLAWLGTENADCRIFDGPAAVGEPCDDWADCAGSDDPNVLRAVCADGTCQLTESFTYEADGPCDTWLALCEEGQHCDLPPLQSGSGTCVPNLPLAAPCTKQVENFECGFQAHCDLTAGICVKNWKVTEGPCTANRWRECRSLECDVVGGERCRHPVAWETLYPEQTVHLDGRLCGAALVTEAPP